MRYVILNDKLTILLHISLLASSSRYFVVLFLTNWFSSILPHNLFLCPTLSFRYLMMYYYLMGWFHNNSMFFFIEHYTLMSYISFSFLFFFFFLIIQ